MRIATFLAGAALAASSLAGAGAHAAVLFSFVGPTAEMPSPDSTSASFTAAGGPGQIDFTIDGFVSLDGQGNCCEDDFTFTLNGVDTISGSWDMGGGGNNVTFFAPSGAVITPTSFGSFAGGRTVISAPINLVAGLNTITFSYSGAPQGLGDEGWDLRDITVTGAARGGGVPEPGAWAMMLLGFGGLGAILRRRTAPARA